jgi:hypothetical protein
MSLEMKRLLYTDGTVGHCWWADDKFSYDWYTSKSTDNNPLTFLKIKDRLNKSYILNEHIACRLILNENNLNESIERFKTLLLLK